MNVPLPGWDSVPIVTNGINTGVELVALADEHVERPQRSVNDRIAWRAIAGHANAGGTFDRGVGQVGRKQVNFFVGKAFCKAIDGPCNGGKSKICAKFRLGVS